MSYSKTNYPTKKALKADFKAGKPIEVYQPGPFGSGLIQGKTCVEGPHFPEPHKWYCAVECCDSVITKIVG